MPPSSVGPHEEEHSIGGTGRNGRGFGPNSWGGIQDRLFFLRQPINHCRLAARASSPANREALRGFESCPPKTVDRLGEVNQAALGGKIENPQRASHTESLAASYNERNGQGDCGCLPFIESFYGSLVELTAWRFVDVKPCRRLGNPVPHRRRSVRVGQLRLHGGWQDHFLKQNWKEIDVSDSFRSVPGS